MVLAMDKGAVDLSHDWSISGKSHNDSISWPANCLSSAEVSSAVVGCTTRSHSLTRTEHDVAKSSAAAGGPRYNLLYDAFSWRLPSRPTAFDSKMSTKGIFRELLKSFILCLAFRCR